MYYLRNFLALGLILCLIPLLIFSPINLQPYERYIWIGILFLWFIQRHQINDQCLIILSASFLTFLFLSCQLWEISRRIIIGLILIIGILLMIIICSLDYTALHTRSGFFIFIQKIILLLNQWLVTFLSKQLRLILTYSYLHELT